ncbi:RILP-like protein homolog isoform X2 [Planococcus citri]|uniref:RILP-like protein homolog isoform X2 n=1 Tax=Planococcus citri TaxID=170843 RepID=UPI0031F9ACB5
MEEYTSDISVLDVYEIASAIGKEFEKIIDVCGADTVTNLMPRVINALEHLESLATKNERENAILEDLKNRIVKLENDKHVRAEDRLKFEKELEQIEEDWRKESNHLLAVIAKLQEENKRLASIVANESYFEQESSSNSEEDVNVVNQLQHQLDLLRDKVKVQNVELNAKNSEIENLESRIETLNTTIVDLRKKQKIHVSQIHGFVEERAKLLIEIQDQRREIVLLHQRLGIVQKENEDLAKSNVEVPDLTNKVLYDVDDPNRPRFTIAELKEILHERNELKAKLNEVQDELALYRPDASIDTSEVATEVDFGDDDLPVQGPLPLEPDDAPWKKSESGIRKLFRKIFIEQSVNPVKRVSIPIFSSKTSSSSSPSTSIV